MEASSNCPDLFVMSKFPGIVDELRKVLPKEVNMVVVPVSDKRIVWDTSIRISDEEINILKQAEVVVIDSMYLAKLLYELPNLKWAQNTWAGVEMLFETFDPTKPLPKYLLTRYVDPYFGELMSNYVIAQIINVERGFYTYWDAQKSSKWSRPFFPNFRVLSDLSIGILGAGNLGSAVGKLLKSSGCHVIAYLRTKRDSPSESFHECTTSVKEILERCDYICNVLPSTKNTVGLLDGDMLKNCKKKPVFINIGRGDIIQENSIIKAVKEGWISKAILDVFNVEPLPPENLLWSTPQVHITPHVGAIPRIDGIAKFIAENYMRYMKGEKLMNLLDWNQGY